MICAGYKWLFGPYGCSYAYYGPYFDQGIPIEENWINRLGSRDFAGLTKYQDDYETLAARYAAGEGGSFIYVKMQNAALEQLLQWQPEDLQKYCQSITKNTVDKLKDLGCYIENETDRTHHLFGVELPEKLNLDNLKLRLNSENIFISFRGDYIRLSSHYFNTASDFDKLYNCIVNSL